MNDKEKLDLIAEAVRDRQRGILNDTSFFVVIASVVIPQEPPSEEILTWAKRSIKEYEEGLERLQ
ncbi:MAG: hypothetical protein WC503_01185 [Candidatus Shapirobacteria bacterium]